jgi:hypothetical protein
LNDTTSTTHPPRTDLRDATAVLMVASMPSRVRSQLAASGGADALRSAVDAFWGPEFPDPIAKGDLFKHLEAFAVILDEKAGPLSMTALGSKATEEADCG